MCSYETDFRTSAETTSAALFIFQPEQNRYVNAIAETITGYSREELLSMNFYDLIHPDFQERIKRHSLALQQSKSVPTQQKLKLLTKNGEERWVDVTLGAVLFEETTAVLGTAYDISTQKQIEAALQVSKEKFRGIFESAPDAIVIFDHLELITLVNTKTRHMFGYSQNELLGKPMELLLPDYAQQVKAQEHLDRLSYPYMRTMNARLELVGVHKNGTEFSVAVKLSPIDLEDGLHIICIIRDITNYKLAEDQTIEAKHLAELGRITAVLAHEINTPLHIIRGHLELIQDFDLDLNEIKQNLQIVRQEIDRLNGVNQRILNYISTRKSPLQLVSLAELIALVLVLVNKRAQQSKVRITTDLKNVPTVLAEPGPLTQVFLNLTINAIESIGETGLLHITLYSEGDQIVVSFMNDGPPIPPSILPQIFDPFFTTKPEGTGIGLWICQSLLQQYGGSIEAKNLRNDQGVVFIIRFPVVPDLKVTA